MTDKEDFEGIFKWKFLVPFMYVASWLCMVFGPLFFSYGYQIYCLVVIGYSLIKTFAIGIACIIALYKLKKILKDEKQQSITSSSEQVIDAGAQNIYHAIIIPSYKEDQELLLETLSRLAMYQKSRQNFLVFLAMQSHEENCQTKAQQIIDKSRNKFRYIGYTRHQVKEGELKGKASNVSWCAQHMLRQLDNSIIRKEELFLTIMDADSWAPKQYFEELQKKLKARPQIFHRSMFCPPQIFNRNHLQVPVFNRIYDTMHSLVHLTNIVSFYFAFPLSNYSISYSLMEEIGFWDTNADSIGEDFHTCQKCFWKIYGRVYTRPIYTPFNQLSLSTGKGYCSDIKARFWQLCRHTRGVSDAAYSCNMLTKAKFQFRNIILTLLVLEVFLVAALMPWAILSIGIQYKLIQDQALHHFPMWVIDVVLNLTPAFTLLSYIPYEWFRRIANKELFQQKNDPWWRCFQYPILFVIALFGYSIPAFILSSFGVLCTKTEYRVAEKVVDKKQKNEELQTKNKDSQNKSTQSQSQEQKKRIQRAKLRSANQARFQQEIVDQEQFQSDRRMKMRQSQK